MNLGTVIETASHQRCVEKLICHEEMISLALLWSV